MTKKDFRRLCVGDCIENIAGWRGTIVGIGENNREPYIIVRFMDAQGGHTATVKRGAVVRRV